MKIQPFELTEECDKRVAKYMLANLDKIEYRLIEDVKYNPKEKMTWYLNKVINSYDGTIQTKYKNKNGERYFVEGFGAQNMIREFRHTLFKNTYYDIDVKNCHPVILLQYCKKNNIKCDELKNYVENRNEFFKELAKKGFDKEEVKIELLKIMNGGKLDMARYEIFESLDRELKYIQSEVMARNDDIVKEVKKAKEKDYYNIQGSVVNHLLCREENTILMSAVRFFRKNNYIIGALCFDGLMIKMSKLIDDSILAALNNYVKTETEYTVEFLIKAMDQGMYIDPAEIEKIGDDVVIETDEDGAMKIIELLNKKIIKSCNRVFLKKFEDTNIYEEDLSQRFSNTKDFLLQFILKISFKKNNGGKLMPYSQNIQGSRALVDATFALIERDDGFIGKMWESNLLKLCFLNGYYNYETKTFQKYDDSVYTSVYVNSNYDDDVSDEYTDILFNKILNPILYNKDAQKRFLNWCARGMAGKSSEKTWSIGLGYRNTGKSILTELFSKSFNSYVKTFNAEEMLCTRAGNGDIAKKLAWLIPFQFTRLNFSNELKTVDESGKQLKLDGNQVKSISSGCDNKQARQNYKDEIEFKIQGRMCLFMNDLIKTNPNDGMDTLQIFEFLSIFKKEITEDERRINDDAECPTKFFLRDDNIMSVINDPNIQKAFVKLIINSYTEESMAVNNADEFNESGEKAEDEIKKHYISTLNKEDKISVSDFNDYNKVYIPTVSKSKMKQLIAKMGVSEKVIKENNKAVRYLCGIKKKEQTDEIHEEKSMLD